MESIAMQEPNKINFTQVLLFANGFQFGFEFIF